MKDTISQFLNIKNIHNSGHGKCTKMLRQLSIKSRFGRKNKKATFTSYFT